VLSFVKQRSQVSVIHADFGKGHIDIIDIYIIEIDIIDIHILDLAMRIQKHGDHIHMIDVAPILSGQRDEIPIQGEFSDACIRILDFRLFVGSHYLPVVCFVYSCQYCGSFC
jgi:hypothetical protein